MIKFIWSMLLLLSLIFSILIFTGVISGSLFLDDAQKDFISCFSEQQKEICDELDGDIIGDSMPVCEFKENNKDIGETKLKDAYMICNNNYLEALKIT